MNADFPFPRLPARDLVDRIVDALFEHRPDLLGALRQLHARERQAAELRALLHAETRHLAYSGIDAAPTSH